MYCQFCTRGIKLNPQEYTNNPTHASEIEEYGCECGMYIYYGDISYPSEELLLAFYWDLGDPNFVEVYKNNFFQYKLPFPYPDFKEKYSILELLNKAILNKDLY